MTASRLPLSARGERTGDSPISYFMAMAVENPAIISLAAGLVDEPSLPVAEVADALSQILADPITGRAALQYGTTQGYQPLRQKILDRFCAADGVTPAELGLSIADVVVSTGSQQLLDLIGTALIDPGDIVIVEAPAYFVYHGVLASLGARVLSVPMDDDGLDVDALDQLLARLERAGELPRVKLIYTCDYFSNPSGLTLSAERRPRLVELARHYGRQQRILILEDGAYRALRYQGDDLPSLKRHDPTNEIVIWTSTFSKPCAPGLKTGFGILPKGLLEPVVRLKGNQDFGSNNLSQHLLDHLIASGAYDRHLTQLCAAYQVKREAMLEAVRTEFADWPGVRWTVPTGGLYVYLTLPPEVATGPDSRFARAALKAGVLYVPGEYGHVADEHGQIPTNEIRLCFGVATVEEIREGVRRLRRAGREIESGTRAEAVGVC